MPDFTLSFEGVDCRVAVRFQKLTVGRYHEIFVAQCFPPSAIANLPVLLPSLQNAATPRGRGLALWECIIRFSREPETVAKLHSEVATMNLLSRSREVTFITSGVNLNMEDKKKAVEQIARVLAKLSKTSFDAIGSLSGDIDGDSPLNEAVGSLLFPDTGVIDWEYSYTAPVYYLYKYPIFLLDTHTTDRDSPWKSILRKHFVRTLIHSFRKGLRGGRR